MNYNKNFKKKWPKENNYKIYPIIIWSKTCLKKMNRNQIVNILSLEISKGGQLLFQKILEKD